MNKLRREQHEQTAFVPYDADRHAASGSQIKMGDRGRVAVQFNMPPLVSAMIAGLICIIAFATWAVWVIFHHEDFISTSTGLMHDGTWLIKAMGIMGLTWLGVEIAGRFVKQVIHPLVEAVHMGLVAIGQVKRNKVLAQMDDWAYAEDETGKLRFHQVTQERTTYNYRGELPSPQDTPLLTAGKPTVAEMVSAITPNSYEVGLGRSLTTQHVLTVELPDAHIKLIGGTRMGKSCEAAAIIDQVCQTHSSACLQIALLDLENKTSRLFEHDPHILTIDTGYKKVKMHARDVAGVAEDMSLLHGLMLYRYTLSDAQLAKEPHILIYLEEFLYWKKLLGQFVSKAVRENALASFAGIATRGIKAKLHLMACAQVDYADDELKDAMAQFLAVNVAFAVKPSAAQAAGFVSTDLLKKNYAARTPGQFVVESIGGADIGVAPEYDVRAKLQTLSVDADTGPQSDVRTEVTEERELQPNDSRTTGRIEMDSALQAKVAQVMENSGENVNDCLLRVWGARPGKNARYEQAKKEYVQVQEIIHAMARQAMQSREEA